MTIEVEFLGAARTVTGSRHIVRTGEATILLDCGLFQGRRSEAERGHDELEPVEPLYDRDDVKQTLEQMISVPYLGRRLVEQRLRVRIFGIEHERRCNVAVLNGFSAHADQRGLVDFAKAVRDAGSLSAPELKTCPRRSGAIA